MRKAFAFLLPIAIGTAFSLAACSFNPNLQGKGESYLQGEWMQDTVPLQKQLVTYSLYSFKFSCDSVYATIRTFSKVNTGYDTCMNAGLWTEYVRGTYQQKNDTLSIKGNFCNADFSLKDAGGCFRSGVYTDMFKVSKKTDSLIQLSSVSSVIPIDLHLTHKISCTPQILVK